MTQVPVANFDALPPELCLPIARISLAESGYDVQDVIRISNINSRMRNIVVNTPDLWRKFTLSDSSSSHEIGILCAQRSGKHGLDLLISLFRPMTQEKEVSSFLKCFKLAAPRIGRLSVYIRHPTSLFLINAVMENEKLSMLRTLNVDYDNKEHQASRWISFPSGGANLRSLSLTGIQTPYDCEPRLENLSSLYIGAVEGWEWMSSGINAVFHAASSLQELHIVGDRGMFYTLSDRGVERGPCYLPALRRVRLANTSPSFMVHFLRGLYAPHLEEADITPPPNRTHDYYGEQVFFGWSEAADSAMRKPALAVPAQSLKLRAGDAENGPSDKVRFVLFLMAIFPYITTLEIEAPFFSISHICQAHAAAQRRGRPLVWTNIETLTIRSYFDHDMEEQYEKAVKQLTESLRELKERGVLNLRELRLSVDHSIQPPVGRVSVEALGEQVGKLILDNGSA